MKVDHFQTQHLIAYHAMIQKPIGLEVVQELGKAYMTRPSNADGSFPSFVMHAVEERCMCKRYEAECFGSLILCLLLVQYVLGAILSKQLITDHCRIFSLTDAIILSRRYWER